MENLGAILGYLAGNIVGAGIVGWLVYSFYDLLRYLLFLLVKIKKEKQKLKPRYRVLKCILIGLPITIIGGQYKAFEGNISATILLLSVSIAWYIVIYKIFPLVSH